MKCEASGFYNFMSGKLLGDGCITKQEKRKPRFQYIHRVEDYGWASHCYDQLKKHIPLSPPKYGKVMDARLKKGYSERFIVQSRTHEIIIDLWNIWYPSGKKSLPFSFIEEYLDKRALAWWYQDDGHLKIVNGTISKLILSTDGFSSEENTRLCQLLFHRFKLQLSMDGQNRLILYDRFQIIYFLHLVSPWLHHSMTRKWLPNQPTRPIAKRTTIYLPTKYLIRKPTAEINDKFNHLNRLIDPLTKKTCPENIFFLFQHRKKKQDEVNGYQIVIDTQHRNLLAYIRQQTGLTISQLAAYCFRI